MTSDHAGRLVRGLVFAAFAVVLVRTAWLCDDAYITFRVVDNAVNGHGLRWNVAERVQVYTHPLWALSLVPLYAATREIYFTALAACGALSLAGACWIAWRATPRADAGALALTVLVSSKAYTDYSTAGLEGPLTHLLLAVFVGLSLTPARSARDLLRRATLAGLIGWTRLDTLLLVLPALGNDVWRLRRERRIVAVCALGLSPVAAWLVFATFYYGHPLPNTAFAKLGAGIGGAELARQGLRYLADSLRHDPLTLAAIACAVAAGMRRGTRLLSAGIVLYLVYVVRAGGDFMSGRLLAAPLLAAAVLLAGEAVRRSPRGVLVAAGVVVVAGCFPVGAPLRSGADYGLEQGRLLDRWGIADERGYYFHQSGWLDGVPGPKPSGVPIAQGLGARRCNLPVTVEGAVGFFGFTAGPGLHIVDYYALGDPVLSRLPAIEEDPLYRAFYLELRGEECPQRMRPGHLLRRIPRGYLTWIAGGPAAFDDPDLDRLVRTVGLATRGPLWESRRLRAVADLTLGRVGLHPAAASRVYDGIPWGELRAALPESRVTQVQGRCTGTYPDQSEIVTAVGAALEECPEDPLAWICLANAYWRQDRPAEAQRALNEALAHEPGLALAYTGLGYVRLKAGDRAGSENAFETALRYDPADIEACIGLADLDLAQNRRDRAVHLLRRVASRAPGRLDARHRAIATEGYRP